jgi:death-on-curing protein
LLRFLTQEEVEKLHDEQLAEYGGRPGVKSYGQLGSCVESPRWVSKFESTEVHHVAAAYFCAIARDHCFEDANKRTAVAATHLFLWLNGYVLLASPEDVRDKAIAAAQATVSRNEIAAWLAGVTSGLGALKAP